MYPSAAMLLLQGVVCCLITLDLRKKRNKIKEGAQGALIVYLGVASKQRHATHESWFGIEGDFACFPCPQLVKY